MAYWQNTTSCDPLSKLVNSFCMSLYALPFAYLYIYMRFFETLKIYISSNLGIRTHKTRHNYAGRISLSNVFDRIHRIYGVHYYTIHVGLHFSFPVQLHAMPYFFTCVSFVFILKIY